MNTSHPINDTASAEVVPPSPEVVSHASEIDGRFREDAPITPDWAMSQTPQGPEQPLSVGHESDRAHQIADYAANSLQPHQSAEYQPRLEAMTMLGDMGRVYELRVSQSAASLTDEVGEPWQQQTPGYLEEGQREAA